MHVIQTIIKENTAFSCANELQIPLVFRPGTVTDSAQRALYFCVMCATSYHSSKPLQDWLFPADCNRSSRSQLCYVWRARWPGAKADGNLHRLFFYLLAFFSGCVDKYLGTVLK